MLIAEKLEKRKTKKKLEFPVLSARDKNHCHFGMAF